MIVTTTGNYHVCDKHMLAALKPGAVVCNIGHFDTEIDTQFMRDNWRWVEIKPQVHQIFRSDDENDYLILLAEGRLVNLGNATGHPSRVMDGSFANQVLAQMYLFEEKQLMSVLTTYTSKCYRRSWTKKSLLPWLLVLTVL